MIDKEYHRKWRAKQGTVWKQQRNEKMRAYRTTHAEIFKAIERKRNSNLEVKAKRAAARKRYDQTIGGKYRRYGYAARRRGYVFALTLKEFKALWQQPCAYCAASITTIGLDRVDNCVGYVASNVVPCCTTCNEMKMERSYEEFITYCRKIVAKADSKKVDGVLPKEHILRDGREV